MFLMLGCCSGYLSQVLLRAEVSVIISAALFHCRSRNDSSSISCAKMSQGCKITAFPKLNKFVCYFFSARGQSAHLIHIYSLNCSAESVSHTVLS